VGPIDRRTFLRLALGSAGVLVAVRGGQGPRDRLPAGEAVAAAPRGPAPPAVTPSTPAVAPRAEAADAGDHIVIANRLGEWRIWKQLTWSDDRTRVIGPGYVGRLELPDGRVLVDDLREPGPLNDPRYGGLGAFGWQHARRGEGLWDLHGRLDAAANGGFGVARSAVARGPETAADGAVELELRVEYRDGWSDPVMAATYRYRFAESEVVCALDVVQLWDGTGPPAFVKEPKAVTSLTGSVDAVEVVGADGGVLRTIDLAALPDPWKGTAQIDDLGRSGLRLLAAPPLTISLDAGGFDAWAALAESRQPLSGAGAAYCLDGGRLKRRWEVVKRRDQPETSCLFNAWEGGSGYPDCEDASRAFGPAGESFTVVLRYA
jgi:hypothetical protein